MVDHDPLTPEQEQLVASLAPGPVRVTQKDINEGPWSRNHAFLVQIEAVGMKIVRVAQNPDETIYEFFKR